MPVTQDWVIMALFNKVDGLCQGKLKYIKEERLENPFGPFCAAVLFPNVCSVTLVRLCESSEKLNCCQGCVGKALCAPELTLCHLHWKQSRHGGVWSFEGVTAVLFSVLNVIKTN